MRPRFEKDSDSDDDDDALSLAESLNDDDDALSLAESLNITKCRSPSNAAPFWSLRAASTATARFTARVSLT